MFDHGTVADDEPGSREGLRNETGSRVAARREAPPAGNPALDWLACPMVFVKVAHLWIPP
jgi:hypothetical protein